MQRSLLRNRSSKPIRQLISIQKGPLKTLDDVADAQSHLNGRYTFVNRIKFSVKKDELDELIADLKQSRRSLEEIARARLDKEVALPNHSPNAIRLAGFLDQIQHHAIGLYSGIHAAWGDKCHSNHAARLLLNSWSEAIYTRRKPRIAFGVAFESSPGPSGMEICKGFSIETLTEADVDTQRPDQYVLPDISRIHTLILLSRACVVRFQNLNLETKATYKVVDSICASFLPTPHTKPPLDCYLSPDQKLRYQSTGETRPLNTSTPIVPNVHLSQSDSVTLDEILTQNIIINPRDGIQIAFALVSAQLQLHSTPWLPKFWSKDILRFPCIKDPQTSKISVIYSCAFLQRPFSATTTADEQSLRSAKRPLLELGIMLLEVYLQQTFTEYAFSVGKRIDDGYGSRYEVAKQWLDNSEQQLLPPHASVISRCIECNFENRSLSYEWHDEKLRQSICENLLIPLYHLAIPRANH